MSRLAQVDLKDCKLQVADVNLVAEGLKQQACCTSLNLANCGIGGDGCEALSEWFDPLQYFEMQLVLSNNKIGDNGAIELTKAFKHCQQS